MPAETSTAEILRDRETESPERPAFADLATSAGPDLTKLGATLQEKIAANEREMLARQKTRDEAQAVEKTALEKRAAESKPAVAGVEQAMTTREAMAPGRPAPVALPTPPTRQLTDFLAPVAGESPQNTITKLIQGIGLLATGFSGLARKDATGALAALSGALKGWHEGDKERADRAFSDWQAQTDKMLAEHRSRVDSYEKIMKDASLTIEQRMQLFNLKAIDSGHDLAIATAGRHNADENLKFTLEYGKQLGALEHQRIMLKQSWDLAEFQRAQTLRIAEMNNATRIDAARVAAGGKKEAQDKMLGEHADKWENAEGARPDPRMTITEASEAGYKPVGKMSSRDQRRSTYVLIDQIEELIPEMEVKGFLAKGSGSAELLMVRAKRSEWIPGIGQAGDPDLVAWMAHAGTMVSIQRQLGDIGPRAMAAFESAVQIISHPTSAEGARQALENLRAAIQAGAPPAGRMAPPPGRADNNPLGLEIPGRR